MEIRGINRGTCHCGSVQFEVELPNGFEDLSRCNCSMCARRGAVVTSVPLAAFRILQGAERVLIHSSWEIFLPRMALTTRPIVANDLRQRSQNFPGPWLALNAGDCKVQSPNNLVPEMREGANGAFEILFRHRGYLRG